MEQDDKRIADLVNKLMDSNNLEKAPLDFTDKVMTKIEGLSETSAIVYKPLIPKPVKWSIIIAILSLIGYILFKTPASEAGLTERYNLPELSFNLLDKIAFDFSSSLMYAMIFLVLMIGIQIPLMKQHFEKRLAI